MCQFIPGQYLLIEIPDSRWLARAYSLGSAPRPDGSIELQIRRTAEGRVTGWLFDELAVGAILIGHGPTGHFTVSSRPGTPLLFVAGGTGFAPIKAMLESQLDQPGNRPIVLVWGNPDPYDFYDVDVLGEWMRSRPGLQVVLAVEHPGHPIAAPSGANTFIGRTSQALTGLGELTGFDVYVAGPPAMIAAALAVLDHAGVPRTQVHVDSFGG